MCESTFFCGSGGSFINRRVGSLIPYLHIKCPGGFEQHIEPQLLLIVRPGPCMVALCHLCVHIEWEAYEVLLPVHRYVVCFNLVCKALMALCTFPTSLHNWKVFLISLSLFLLSLQHQDPGRQIKRHQNPEETQVSIKLLRVMCVSLLRYMVLLAMSNIIHSGLF